MNWHIPQETIDEVKQRTNIVDLVSEFVTLKKAGRNFTGLCPFHSEKTPSFSVNPEKQIFRCYGCGEGGNVITFVMKMNSSSFPEAVRYLAAKAGIEIPLGKTDSGTAKKASEREKLIKINRMAADFFSRNHCAESGSPARDYLSARGMNAGIVETFQLGYAPPGWRNLRNYLAAAKVPEKLMEKAGLVVVKDDSTVYDRFRERLILPIENLNGEIVAFGGRDLGGGEPKYLNSPESPLYVKGDNLYGLYRTRNDVRRKDSLILVEGYFDFLSLWNAGIKNVAATLGTALTRRQVELIRRFTRNVVLIFDGDQGGRGAVERSLSLFLGEGVHARIVLLPNDSDPDDFVRKWGKDALDELILRAPSAVDYYIDSVMGGNRSVEEKAELAEGAISFIAAIDDLIQRDLFIKRVSEKLGLDEALVKREVGKIPAKKEATRQVSETGGSKRAAGLEPVELYLIYLMIEYSRKISQASSDNILEYFTDSRLKKAGETVFDAYGNRWELAISDIADRIDDEAVRDGLLKLAMNESREDGAIVDKIFDDTMIKIKARWYKERHRILRQQMVAAREKGDSELLNRLLMEKNSLLGEEKVQSARIGEAALLPSAHIRRK